MLGPRVFLYLYTCFVVRSNSSSEQQPQSDRQRNVGPDRTTRHRSSSITLPHTRIVSQAYKHKRRPADDSQCEVLLRVAAIPEKPRPQLYANDAEDEEDKEAEEEDVAQHWQSVQQQVHEDTHAWSDRRKHLY